MGYSICIQKARTSIVMYTYTYNSTRPTAGIAEQNDNNANENRESKTFYGEECHTTLPFLSPAS